MEYLCSVNQVLHKSFGIQSPTRYVLEIIKKKNKAKGDDESRYLASILHSRAYIVFLALDSDQLLVSTGPGSQLQKLGSCHPSGRPGLCSWLQPSPDNCRHLGSISVDRNACVLTWSPCIPNKQIIIYKKFKRYWRKGLQITQHFCLEYWLYLKRLCKNVLETKLSLIKIPGYWFYF